MDSSIEWIASFIAIITSTFRAFNLGYQGPSYIVSVFCQIVFIMYSTKQSQIVLNFFYIITALIGAYRWRNTSSAPSEKKASV